MLELKLAKQLDHSLELDQLGMDQLHLEPR